MLAAGVDLSNVLFIRWWTKEEADNAPARRRRRP
jgi:hypothetical protein